MGQHFKICLRSGPRGLIPPPTVSLTVKYPFFTIRLILLCRHGGHKSNNKILNSKGTWCEESKQVLNISSVPKEYSQWTTYQELKGSKKWKFLMAFAIKVGGWGSISFVKTIQNHSLTAKTRFAHCFSFIICIYSRQLVEVTMNTDGNQCHRGGGSDA